MSRMMSCKQPHTCTGTCLQDVPGEKLHTHCLGLVLHSDHSEEDLAALTAHTVADVTNRVWQRGEGVCTAVETHSTFVLRFTV